MFAIPGILGLLTFIYVRPQEIVDALAKIPFLYLFLALAALGYAVDLRLRITRPVATPQLPWVALFLLWQIVNLVVVTPPELFMLQFINTGVTFVLFFVLAQGIQTFKVLQLVGAVVIGFSLFVAAVGVHQGYAPTGCVVLDPAERDSTDPDGRPCETAEQCYGQGAEPGAEYGCERVGLFRTTTIEDRVRYRGVLKDPNDLALTVSVGFALLIGLASARRKPGTYALLVAGGVLTAWCVVLTKSRGGQLVFLAVVGVYFLKRMGWRGILLAMMLAAPLLLKGGRSGAEASQSANERYEAWAAGVAMFRNHPLTGVGKGAFGEYHYLTAHNAYVLAPAELGFPGMFLWTVILYLSIKIPLQAVRDFARVPGARVARVWSMALLAAMAGMCVGILFLSFTYHYVLWIYFGLCGALYSSIHSHAPTWRVRVTGAELAAIALGDLAFLGLVEVVTRLKGF